MSKVPDNEEGQVFAVGLCMFVLAFLMALLLSSGMLLFSLNVSVVVFLLCIAVFGFLVEITKEERDYNSRMRNRILFWEKLAFVFAVYLLFKLLLTGDLTNLLVAVILFGLSFALDRDLPEEISDDQ